MSLCLEKPMLDTLNAQDAQMIQCFLNKCAALTEFVSEVNEDFKRVVREIKSKGGWYAELSQKKIIDMCAAYHWCIRAAEEIKFDASKFTFSAFQKFISLKDSLKQKMWELWSERNGLFFDEEIIDLNIFKKLKDAAICALSKIKIMGSLALEMEGMRGLQARKIIAKVSEKIESAQEQIKPHLYQIANDLAEQTNLDCSKSLKKFEEKISASEEALANQISPDLVYQAIELGCIEPSGESLRKLNSFNQKLFQARKSGLECLASLEKITLNPIKEEIEKRLDLLKGIQLSLDIQLEG